MTVDVAFSITITIRLHFLSANSVPWQPQMCKANKKQKQKKPTVCLYIFDYLPIHCSQTDLKAAHLVWLQLTIQQTEQMTERLLKSDLTSLLMKGCRITCLLPKYRWVGLRNIWGLFLRPGSSCVLLTVGLKTTIMRNNYKAVVVKYVGIG